MEKLKKWAVAMMAMCMSAAMSVMVFANETGTGIASQIGTAATSAATEAQSVISTLIPIVLGVVGTVVVVRLGIRLFKSFMKA